MAGQIFKLCSYFLISQINGLGGGDPIDQTIDAGQYVHSTELKSAAIETSRELADGEADTRIETHTNPADNKQNVEQSAAQFMPESTVFFVEIKNPPALIDSILNHPVRKKIDALDPVKEFYKSPEFLAVQFGEKYIQWQLGDSWDNLLKSLTDRGMYLAFDAKTQGTVIVFRSSDQTKLKRVAGALLGFVESQANDNGTPVPFKKSTYRGHSTAQFDEAIIARVNDWFLVSNKQALARQVADRIIDGDTDSSLAGNGSFSNAISGTQTRGASSQSDLWAYANLETLRDAGVAKELFAGRTDQPFAELLVGGVLESLKSAKYASAQLNLDDQGISILVSTPFDKTTAAQDRAYFFGDDKDGQAPKPLLPENTIANVIAHRDIAKWWLSKESLFDESVIAGLAQADSQLSTMFAGLDFGEEVLGATQPGVQVVVTEQTFPEAYQPDVKLPSFAMVFRLKESELDIRRRFKIAYQSLLGIVNYSLAQEGNPQLEMATEKTTKGEIISATYLLSDDDRKGLINYNFSPSIAFSGDYFVISSTKQLATELSQLAESADPEATVATNTLVTIDADELDNILKLNRESFIAQSMIENGQDRDAATEETDALLMIAQFFEQAKLELKVNPKSIDLSARIDIK